MRRQLLAGGALACALLAAGSAAAQTYDRLVVFGDSLSDNGNLFRATGGTNPPSPPYFQGRFSNGPVFTELLGFNLSGFGTVTGSTNYAFGGARTDLQQSPPSLRNQFAAYRAGGGQFGPNDLVIAYGGANNIIQYLQSLAVTPNPNPLGGLQTVVGGAAADMGLLINAIAAGGAGTVLVPNLPSLGATPAFSGTAARDLATGGSLFFNAALLAQTNAASAANTSTNFIYMDVSRAAAFIAADPAAFGITNAAAPCLVTDPRIPNRVISLCSNPDQFLFFDGVHPSASVHRALAALTQDYIAYGTRGAASAALGETSLMHRESAQDAALERLGERPGAGPVRFSLSVEGGRTTDDARGDVPEIERDTASISIAGDGQLRPGVTLGLQGHAARSSIEAGALSADAESLALDAYLGFDAGPVFVNVVLGGSADSYTDYRRATGVGPITHSADRIDGAGYGGKLQAGYRLPVGAGELSPRAAVSAIKVEVDPFSENGAAARHAQAAHDIEAVAAEASLRYDLPLGRLRAHLEGGYADFLSYDGDVATALVDNPARPLSRAVEEPGRGGLVRAGVSGDLGGGVRLGLSYRGQFAGERDAHAAALTVSYRPGS